MFDSIRNTLYAREIIMASKPSKLRLVIKALLLAAIAVAFSFTSLYFKNYSLDVIWTAKILLGFIAICVIVCPGKKVPIPSPIELRFFSDYLLFHRPRRRYNSWVTRKEYSKIKYADISQCIYFAKSNKICLYGKQYAVHYDIVANGAAAPTPLYAGFIEGVPYEFSICDKNGLKLKNAIEAHSPLRFVVKYR